MRIAIWHNTGLGGARRHLYQHVCGLAARGHDLESWCLSTVDHRSLSIGEIVKEHIMVCPISVDESKYAPLRWGRRFFETSRKLHTVEQACKNCAEEINKRRFDLLLATNCSLSGIPPIARYLSIPSAIYIHEPWRCLYESLPILPWLAPSLNGHTGSRFKQLKRLARNEAAVWNARVFAREERKNAAVFSTRLVNSFFTRESVLRAYGLDAHVCYQGVDIDLFHSFGARRERIVLGIGEYSFHKNIPFAIRSLAMMSPPRPRLVWLANGGSRALMEELKTLAASLNVDYEPYYGVSDEKLVEWYNRASVLIYTPRLEPFGLAPLEANACELPVVAVAEGGIRETVLDGVNGVLCESDPVKVSEAIRKLLSEPEWARELGRRGRARVEAIWNLDISVERLEHYLEKTASKSG